MKVDNPVTRLLYWNLEMEVQIWKYRDLALLIALTCLTIISVAVPVLSQTLLRSVLGVLFVLFAPGYALVSALFQPNSDLNLLDRLAISFGLSIAAIIIMGFGLSFTPLRLNGTDLLLSLSGLVFFCCIIAFYRRYASQ